MYSKIGILVGVTLFVTGSFVLMSGHIAIAFLIGMPGVLLAILCGIVWLCKKQGLNFD